MILINNEEYNREKIDELLLRIKDLAVTPEKEIFYKAYKEYLDEIYLMDNNLQNDVKKHINDDLISYIEIPCRDTDDYGTVKFFLEGTSKDRVLKKREEFLFKNLCEKHLKKFNNLITILHRKLYI